MATKIEWAEESLNVVTGCTEKSPGCANCYARKMSKRLQAMGQEKYRGVVDEHGRWTGKVNFHAELLKVPEKWRKPRRVFLNSMSDTFHEDVTREQIFKMLDMILENGKHTFVVVTKRAARARREINLFCETFLEGNPIPNLWLVVSAEDQKRYDERIGHLVKTNVVVRGLSLEPLLGSIDLRLHRSEPCDHRGCFSHVSHPCEGCGYQAGALPVDWIIVGGESGPGARIMKAEWARSLRDQAQEIGAAFFFKQWGGPNKKATGRMLGGRIWDEYPSPPALKGIPPNLKADLGGKEGGNASI